MSQHHGLRPLKGLDVYTKKGAGGAQQRDDRFGRMFPDLPGAYVSPVVLGEIGRPEGEMQAPPGGKDKTQSVPVGQVFFGQFIDHDITLDVSSSFARVNNPSEIENVRTPELDLDCIYGSGPEPQPYLFAQEGPLAGAAMLTGADQATAFPHAADDLLRAPNGRAMIGDPRNDENRIISQLQLGVIRFHNLQCRTINADTGATGHDLYEEAKQITTWHYQWAVVNDFLADMCGRPVVDDILGCGRRFYCPETTGSGPFIPVEFSVAAYRFGHSMAPQVIQVQPGERGWPLFRGALGPAFTPLPSSDGVVDWNQVMDAGGNRAIIQRAETMDTQLAPVLLQLPFVNADTDEASLATRNLLRGNAFQLPGGDHVAAHMGRDAAEIAAVMQVVSRVSNGAITKGAPLWLYLLAEAEAVGRETAVGQFDPGEGLGPVGARIVAEVLIGLLELDPKSYLGGNRNWAPTPAYDSIGKMMIASKQAVGAISVAA